MLKTQEVEVLSSAKAEWTYLDCISKLIKGADGFEYRDRHGHPGYRYSGLNSKGR